MSWAEYKSDLNSSLYPTKSQYYNCNDDAPPSPPVYFPKVVFTNIIEYCGETLEQKRDRLWSYIDVHRGYPCLEDQLYNDWDDVSSREVVASSSKHPTASILHESFDAMIGPFLPYFDNPPKRRYTTTCDIFRFKYHYGIVSWIKISLENNRSTCRCDDCKSQYKNLARSIRAVNRANR